MVRIGNLHRVALLKTHKGCSLSAWHRSRLIEVAFLPRAVNMRFADADIEDKSILTKRYTTSTQRTS